MPYFALIRERGDAWDWSLPMRRQAEWEAHAAFIEAPELGAIDARIARDPWTQTGLLRTASVEPWTVLLGTIRHTV
jgi:hypothetical protein